MVTLSQAATDAAVAAVAATANSGSLDLYTGTAPASPQDSATGTLLGSVPFAATAFGAVSSGVATANPFGTGYGVADGTPGWFRAPYGDGVIGEDLSCPPITNGASLVPSDVTVGVEPGRFPTSTSGRNLLDQYGDPWYGLGDSPWSMPGVLSPSEVTTYLDNRQAKGFNLIIFRAPEAYYSNDPVKANYAGETAWTGTEFQSTLNSTYWDHVEFMVDECRKRGITILFNPVYLGFDSFEGWRTEMAAATDSDMTTYGEYLAARFASYPNIIWYLGHDSNPDATYESRANALGRFVATRRCRRSRKNPPTSTSGPSASAVCGSGTCRGGRSSLVRAARSSGTTRSGTSSRAGCSPTQGRGSRTWTMPGRCTLRSTTSSSLRWARRGRRWSPTSQLARS